jgi:hypothetical protein
MRGINTILITGKILSDSIPIGADTEPVSIMTRIFIISTIVARVAVGIKASKGLVLPEPPVLGNIPEPLGLANIPEPLGLPNIPEPLVLANIPEPLVLGNLPEPLDLGNIPEPLVLGNIPEPLVRAFVNLEKLLLMRKKSSSRPSGLNTEKAR